jgi:hypothetical protein
MTTTHQYKLIILVITAIIIFFSLVICQIGYTIIATEKAPFIINVINYFQLYVGAFGCIFLTIRVKKMINMLYIHQVRTRLFKEELDLKLRKIKYDLN